ncbi:MAG: microtubule-binding protein [Proteobacteria bacterium]|jgi:myosin heavy subunit|nr:microtubule-binding protein [Pseudomonadota bacterium]
MPFQYRKNDSHGGGDSFWTSYSDLFLGLSAIFLLLYVVSSLRTGADSIKQQMQNQQLSMKVKDLETQLQFYEQAKQEYMKQDANQEEVSEYQELMDKLVLLEQEAKTESEKLKKAMLENQSKEKALNKYQQMVRNVINASKFEKVKVQNRNQVISEKNETIGEQSDQIQSLQADITEKQILLQKNQKEILDTRQKLDRRRADLQKALKEKEITRQQYEQKMTESKALNDRRVQALVEKQNEVRRQLAEAEGKARNLAGELGQTQAQLGTAQNHLQQTAGALEQTKGVLAQTKGALEQTKGALAQAQAELSARKNFAKSVKSAFDRKGIKAEVDMDSGEVYLDFGKTYFDVDSAKLKAEMKKVIQEAMPIYAKSLFGDPKIAQKVSSVEIIGFASPTYKGKFVDPKSNNKEDQEALKYNMDLSYRRAKSIFNHVVDRDNVSFQHQTELLPLLKVSGRSYLDQAKVNRNVASEDFCKVNDCKRAQRVVIRFSMDKKK